MPPTRRTRSSSSKEIPANASSSSSSQPTVSAITNPPAATKRRSTETATRSPAKKRARKQVEPDGTQQVSASILPPDAKLRLADADVFYLPHFVEDESKAKEWYQGLLDLPDWYRPTLRVYGKDVTQSRQIAAYANDPNLKVKYSGHPVKMQYDIPPLLQEIWDKVEERLQVKFNHCMLNLYEYGNVYIGNHRDNKENRVIASLSLGATRTFNLTHTSPPSASSTSAQSATESPSSTSPNSTEPLSYSHTLPLTSGSLLIMQGATQQKWKHQIPKEKKVKDGRISLTFRQLVF
ncbi:hypothetical protein JCM11641_001697 [Rhodosporidiobolus odoratus]